LEQARTGTDEELPYILSSAAKDRSRVVDRLDRAIKANQTLQAELRDAQRNLEKCTKVCGLWAQRIIIMEAEKVAAELFEVQQHADSLRDDLNALSYCTFPGSGGPIDFTPTLRRALDLQSKPREENFRLIEPLKEHWLRRFEFLLENAGKRVNERRPPGSVYVSADPVAHWNGG
jgi:hypothetical protein